MALEGCDVPALPRAAWPQASGCTSSQEDIKTVCRYLLVIVLLLLVSIGTASAECAWVLWTEQYNPEGRMGTRRSGMWARAFGVLSAAEQGWRVVKALPSVHWPQVFTAMS